MCIRDRLAWESIEKAQAMGLDVAEGDFAENVTTEGIDLLALPLGTRDVYKRQRRARPRGRVPSCTP